MARKIRVFDIGGHEVVVVIESGLRFRDLLVDGHSLVTGEQVSEKVNWAEHSEQVPIDLKPPRSLAYPPSVAALPPDLRKVTREEAAAIARAALIGLLAQGHVQIYHYRFKQLGWGSVLKLFEDVYAVVGTQELDQAQLEGRLERQIQLILSKQKRVEKWYDGPPIYDLVRSLIEGPKDDPATWLARFVADDAAAHGWGQFMGFQRKSFKWDDAHTSQLQREREVIRGLSSQLLQLNPDFSHEMDREIVRGIKSRVDMDY